MKKILIVLMVIAVAALAVFYSVRDDRETVASDESQIRALVEGFGERLKNVSLLDSQGVASAMEREYGEYLAPELLSKWQSDPDSALGRLTSSPWPDRIEIESVEAAGESSHRVTGSIVEVTNEGGGIGEEPTEASRRPVAFTVERAGTGWLITDVISGAYPGDGEWTLSSATSQGIQFMYPDPLPTKYVSAVDWPPGVDLSDNEFSCVEGPVTAADGPLKRLERRTVGDRIYCVSIASGGAAGSIYMMYEYTTEFGGRTARTFFTLRLPQCMNYDDPEQSACRLEQESFDVDGLADRIIGSIREI